MKEILQIIFAYFGSLGFAMLFNMKKERLLPSAILGALCWIIYLVIMKISSSIFLASLIGAFASAALAEVLARKVKAPAMIFYLIGIIPLVPGGTLYYLMEAVVKSDSALISQNAYKLIWTIVGMGVGVSLVQGFLTAAKQRKTVKTDKTAQTLHCERFEKEQDYKNDSANC